MGTLFFYKINKYKFIIIISLAIMKICIYFKIKLDSNYKI